MSAIELSEVEAGVKQVKEWGRPMGRGGVQNSTLRVTAGAVGRYWQPVWWSRSSRASAKQLL